MTPVPDNLLVISPIMKFRVLVISQVPLESDESVALHACALTQQAMVVAAVAENFVDVTRESERKESLIRKIVLLH